MRFLALWAGLALSLAVFQVQAQIVIGGGGGGLVPSSVIDFRGTCTVDCNTPGNDRAAAKLGVRTGYVFGEALQAGDVQSFSYQSRFGPFNQNLYGLGIPDPTYTIDAVSGVIPFLPNPIEGFFLPGSPRPADVTISGTVTGLLGSITQFDNVPLADAFTFVATDVFDFVFQSSAATPGYWSLALTGNGLPALATADAGTDGEYYRNIAVSMEGPGDFDIPAPGTLAMFAIGLAGFAAVRRRAAGQAVAGRSRPTSA